MYVFFLIPSRLLEILVIIDNNLIVGVFVNFLSKCYSSYKSSGNLRPICNSKIFEIFSNYFELQVLYLMFYNRHDNLF